MGEHESYPPPNFSCPPQEPILRPPVFHWTPQQQPDTFQASRDWSWTQPAPTGPWSSSFNHHTGFGQTSYYSQHQYTGQYHHQNHGYRHGRQGPGQHQWGKKQKKQKEPEFSYFCDTCDKGFKNQEKYDDHISQHVKCSVEDCNFTAHEKIVNIHWKNNHAPGAKRIKLDTPEEIAKWREERRKNYPTLSNVEKKMKIIEVKEQRGDVLETAQFGRIKSYGRGRGGSHHGRGFNRQIEGSHKRFHPDSSSESEQPAPPKRPSQDGDPLGALVNSDPDSEKEESATEKQSGLSVAPKNVTSALGSLMSSYGEDMTASESEGEPDESPVLKATQALVENKALLATHPVPAQRSTPLLKENPKSEKLEESQQQSHNTPDGSGSGRGRGRWGRKGARGRGGGQSNPSQSQQHRPTLLEMLLAPDIRHERNVILQCVRFIVRNGFFGLAGKDCSEIELPENTTVNSDDPLSEDKNGGHNATDVNVTVDGREHSVTQTDSQSQEELNNARHSITHADVCQGSKSFSQGSETSLANACENMSVARDDAVNEIDGSCTVTVGSSQSPAKADKPRVLLQLFAQSLVCDDPDDPTQRKDVADAAEESQNRSTEAIAQSKNCEEFQKEAIINSVDY